MDGFSSILFKFDDLMDFFLLPHAKNDDAFLISFSLATPLIELALLMLLAIEMVEYDELYC